MEADDQPQKSAQMCSRLTVTQPPSTAAAFFFNVFGPLRHSIENQDGAFDWARVEVDTVCSATGVIKSRATMLIRVPLSLCLPSFEYQLKYQSENLHVHQNQSRRGRGEQMEQRLECDCCCVGHFNWRMGFGKKSSTQDKDSLQYFEQFNMLLFLKKK